MLSPAQNVRLRRYRVALGLAVTLAGFHLANALLFEPTARRYERAVRQLGELGLGSQPGGSGRVLPPRLYRLMAENSRRAAEVAELGATGGLATALLETSTRLMTECGVEVMATDPGNVVQSPRVAQVHVELKARARYAQLVTFLDRLSGSGKLIEVDRLNLVSDTPEQVEAQLSLTQYVFKTGPEAR